MNLKSIEDTKKSLQQKNINYTKEIQKLKQQISTQDNL